MRKSLLRCVGFAVLLSCMLPSAPFLGGHVSLAQANTEYKPIPPETKRNLSFAKKYEKERRYELARQHYLLALSTSNTTTLRDTIRRDLEMIELKIRTLR